MTKQEETSSLRVKLEQIEELRAQLAQITARLDKLSANEPKPDKWEPKGGPWVVYTNGEIEGPILSVESFRMNGVEYATREAAESAVPYMRFCNRLLCLAAELNPSGKVGGNWAIEQDTVDGEFYVVQLGEFRSMFGLFKSEEVANRACAIMNRDKWQQIETT